MEVLDRGRYDYRLRARKISHHLLVGATTVDDISSSKKVQVGGGRVVGSVSVMDYVERFQRYVETSRFEGCRCRSKRTPHIEKLEDRRRSLELTREPPRFLS